MAKLDILLVGNYVHDTLVHSHGRYEVQGGSASYISRALRAAGVNYRVVAKVGRDFRYHHAISDPPILSDTHPTTHFIDDFTGDDMAATLRAVCEPIRPADLGDAHARIGLAVGVAMEILPETLVALRERCDLVISDIQALIRKMDPTTGVVSLQRLSETPFRDLMDCIDILKTNTIEADFVDVPIAGDLVITEGSDGVRLRRHGRDEFRVPAFPARKIDPTGAGDSFVAGLALGLLDAGVGLLDAGVGLLDAGVGLTDAGEGRKVAETTMAEAVRLGNRFGAFSVETIGIPDFSSLVASGALRRNHHR